MKTKRLFKEQPPTLQVKRARPAKRRFWTFRSVIRGRGNKHRVEAGAAGAAGDVEESEHTSMLTRGLIIMFGVHIVAIGLYFVHVRFLGERTDGPKSAAVATRSEPVANAAPLIQPGDRTTIVSQGETYQIVAAREGVSEGDLREANANCPITPGLKLIVPPPHIAAALPADVESLRNPAVGVRPADDGLVDTAPEVPEPSDVAPPAREARQVAANSSEPVPRAVPVREPSSRATAVAKIQTVGRKPETATGSKPKAAGRAHTVRAGDNIYQLSKRFKVDPKALMKANGISDPRKLRVGATLKIP